jgi:hypothetical protein
MNILKKYKNNIVYMRCHRKFLHQQTFPEFQIKLGKN